MGWIIGIGIGVIFVALIVIAIVLVISTYNKLVVLRNKARNSWAQVDAQLQRRFDLIPNLVETVKGFAAHEAPVFEAAEDLKVVALESMMGEDEASVEAANAFETEFQTGLFAFVGAVMQQYPALYTLMMGGSGASAE